MVTGTASDSHTWNLVFLQLLLEELGQEVTNLGPCVPDDLLVDEARRRRPKLIVMSSVNGHGATDGMRVVEKLREQPELAGTRIVIGGKLGIAGAGNTRHTAGLVDAGFDAVFEEGAGLGLFRSYVAALPVGASR
nr:cobalamin-dependent protein [Allocatelliglobosispora scoriae]